MNRLNDLFDEEPEQGHDRSRLSPVPALEGRVSLENVKFRYGGPDSPLILGGITVDVRPGTTVAWSAAAARASPHWPSAWPDWWSRTEAASSTTGST